MELYLQSEFRLIMSKMYAGRVVSKQMLADMIRVFCAGYVSSLIQANDRVRFAMFEVCMVPRLSSDSWIAEDAWQWW